MAVAGTENNALLFGASTVEQVAEEILTHCLDPIRQKKLLFVLGFSVEFINLLFQYGLTGESVHWRAGNDLLFRDAGIIEIDSPLPDFAGCEVAVFDGLCYFVFVHRQAEVVDVVGCDFGVFDGFAALFFAFELAGCCGETYLDCVAVTGEYL